jgi:hypothetical protein
MYRRKFVRSHPINHPDALHLHTLIYRRLILNPTADMTSADKNKANAKVALVVWAFVLVPVVCALVFCHHTNALLGFIAFFALAYGCLYKRLIQFKAPRVLVSTRRSRKR